MKTKKIFYSFGLLFILCLPKQTVAQTPVRCEECETFLDQLRTIYSAPDGNSKVDEATYAKLKACQENCSKTFDKNSRVDIYKYLTIMYLYLFDDNAQAQQLMNEFIIRKLRAEPLYSPKDNSPENSLELFKNMYDNTRHLPVFFVGFRGGLGLTQPIVQNTFSPDPEVFSAKRGRYISLSGYNVGFFGEFQLLKAYKLTLIPEIAYSQYRFEYKDKINDFANLSAIEEQSWLSIPALLRLYLQRKEQEESSRNRRFQLFFQAGFSLDLLAGASADLIRIDELETGNRTEIETDDGGISLSGLRKKTAISLIGGGGFKVRNFANAKFDLSLDARYLLRFQNAVNTDRRFDFDPSLLYDFGYISDDFSLQNLTLSLSISVPFYRPKALNKKVEKDYQLNFGEN